MPYYRQMWWCLSLSNDSIWWWWLQTLVSRYYLACIRLDMPLVGRYEGVCYWIMTASDGGGRYTCKNTQEQTVFGMIWWGCRHLQWLQEQAQLPFGQHGPLPVKIGLYLDIFTHRHYMLTSALTGTPAKSCMEAPGIFTTFVIPCRLYQKYIYYINILYQYTISCHIPT